MRRAIWTAICFVLLFVSGCIDLNEDVGPECLADRRCGANDATVCGVDGVEYECASMAQCYGVEIDDTGQACDGQAQCEPVACRLYCENGFKTDENGCEICECKQVPGGSCQDDPCVPFQCGGASGQCVRESELATMGACPAVEPGYFTEPSPQCVCGDASCAARPCSADADCTGQTGLCVQPLTDDRIGSCVDGTCGDIEVGYEVAAETFNACQSDDDCTLYSPLNDCCGGFAVNDEGVYAMQQIDGFASRTSCGRDWAETCTMVDCAEPPSDAVACVQGRCQRADF